MIERARALYARTSLRLAVRGAFLIYFVYLCWKLLRFVAWARGEGAYVSRPEAVAGILPVGHYTSFFAWLKGGGWDVLLPSGLVIIIAALVVSLLFKRGFCGWICPVGTLWESAAVLGRKLLGRNVRLPWWFDLAGRALRYVIAAAAIGFLLMVPVAEAVAFRELPYMWVADIKIVEGFGNPIFIAVAALAFVVSMMLGPVWCRWLCPLGGMYSVLGVLSPLAIHRDADTCTSCSRCSKVCHAFVRVDAATRVWEPECDGCMDCVRECPVEGCLQPKAFGRIRVPVWVWPVLVVGVWLAIYSIAKATGHWDTTIPDDFFRQIINSGLLEQRTRGGL